MTNGTMTNVFIESIDKITFLKDTNCLAIYIGDTTLILDENPIEIKVGDNKVKVSTLDFMEAFKDMLDTGVFEMDQIDSAVWKIELELEETRNQLEVKHE